MHESSMRKTFSNVRVACDASWFDAEHARHLDRGAGGAGDRDQRVRVRRVDLLHVARRDAMAFGGKSIASHQHTVAITHRENGRAVRHGSKRGRLDGVAQVHVRSELRKIDFDQLEEARALVLAADEHPHASGWLSGYCPPRCT
jgi:hypothetical protein